MNYNKGTVIETKQGTIKIVQFNKPSKKNAIDLDMYIQITKILNEAAENDDISVMVLTGTGDYYSSGNDITASLEKIMNRDINGLSQALSNFIQAFITFPKILIAIVNGPAIGIAATTLALCDIVFASEKSFFYTPFTKLGIVAEACSTYTFPRLIGDRKAAEMLVYNHKMSAQEALEWGFVNYIYKPEELQNKVWDKIEEVSKLPKHSMAASKKLLRGELKQILMDTNDKEIEELNTIWTSQELQENYLKSINRKSKL